MLRLNLIIIVLELVKMFKEEIYMSRGELMSVVATVVKAGGVKLPTRGLEQLRERIFPETLLTDTNMQDINQKDFSDTGSQANKYFEKYLAKKGITPIVTGRIGLSQQGGLKKPEQIEAVLECANSDCIELRRVSSMYLSTVFFIARNDAVLFKRAEAALNKLVNDEDLFIKMYVASNAYFISDKEAKQLAVTLAKEVLEVTQGLPSYRQQGLKYLCDEIIAGYLPQLVGIQDVLK